MHTLAGVRRGWHASRPSGYVLAASSATMLLVIFAGPHGRPVWPGTPEAPLNRTYKVLIDLSRKETFVTIPGTVETTRLLDVQANQLPSPHQLIPTDGIVRYGQCVDIVLTKSPDVHIRLSIVRRGRELAAKISPLIDIGRDDPVEFTHDRIKRTLWSFQRRVKDLQEQISASRAEYQRNDTWLATPGNKPLYLHKAVRLRQKILVQQIVAYQWELPPAQRRYASIRAIIELASKMHATTEVRFTVKVGS